MTFEEGRRCTALIQVGRESLAWRVRAGDASTPFFRLTSKPRPHAKQFQKTYRFPAYAALPPRAVVETNGDLQALAGSLAEIVVRPDQPIARGHLLVEWEGTTETVALQPIADGRLSAVLTIEKNGTYQVHLTAAETGFDSRFEPRYQITAEPDLAPIASIQQPPRLATGRAG